ncbi:MAG: hypothetical protein ABJB03_02995 [Rhodoglobus sp.]
MELLFVTILGAGFGAIIRYILPNRHSYGLFLLPAVGAIIASVVWVGIGLWALRWTFDGGWIWVAALVAAGAAALAVGLIVPRRRHEADAQLLATLSGGKA